MTRKTLKQLRHKRTFVDDFWDTWDKVVTLSKEAILFKILTLNVLVDKIKCDKNKETIALRKKEKSDECVVVSEISTTLICDEPSKPVTKSKEKTPSKKSGTTKKNSKNSVRGEKNRNSTSELTKRSGVPVTKSIKIETVQCCTKDTSSQAVPSLSIVKYSNKAMGTTDETGYEISSHELVCCTNDRGRPGEANCQAYRDMVRCIAEQQEKALLGKATKGNDESTKEQGKPKKEYKKVARFVIKTDTPVKTTVNRYSNSNPKSSEIKSSRDTSPTKTYSTDTCASCNVRRKLKVTDSSTQYEEYRKYFSSNDLSSYTSLDKSIYTSKTIPIGNELSDESTDRLLVESANQNFPDIYSSYKEAYKTCYKPLMTAPPASHNEIYNYKEEVSTPQPNGNRVEDYQKQLSKAYRNSVAPNGSPGPCSSGAERGRSLIKGRSLDRTRSPENASSPQRERSPERFYQGANTERHATPKKETYYHHYSTPKIIYGRCPSPVRGTSPLRYIYPEKTGVTAVQRSLSPCRNRFFNEMAFANYYCSVAAMKQLPVLPSPEASMMFHTAQSTAPIRSYSRR